jgi:hypothetical protein
MPRGPASEAAYWALAKQSEAGRDGYRHLSRVARIRRLPLTFRYITDAAIKPLADRLALRIAKKLTDDLLVARDPDDPTRCDLTAVTHISGPIYPVEDGLSAPSTDVGFWLDKSANEMAQLVKDSLKGRLHGYCIDPELPLGAASKALGRCGAVAVRVAVGFDIYFDRFLMRADMLVAPK